MLALSFDKHASCKARIAELPHIQSPRALSGPHPRLSEVKTTGVLLRSGGLTNEGYGSFFHRIKSSIILSMVLDKTLVIEEPVRSEHNYSVAAMINEASGNPPHGPPCDLQLHDEERVLLDSACRSMHGSSSTSSGTLTTTSRSSISILQTPAGSLQNWLSAFKANNSCVDVQHSKVQELGKPFVEDHEEFNDCIQPWLSDMFHKQFERRGYQLPSTWQSDTMHVGIHIRWGDVATTNLSKLNARSMQLSQVNSAVDALQQTGKNFEFHVFAKNPSEALLAELLFTYTVVNNADDLHDIFMYSQMDMYVQGPSAFSVMASLINPNKIVVTNMVSTPMYRFYYKQINAVYDVADPCYIQHLLSLEA